ncbi:MAG: cytochrome c [ANME-2 cluster archaeon]|nr:cytochrome c [ANME-2 cluster archaeon]
MNNLRIILIALIIPSLLMIPYSILSFYTDFANNNPDPSLATVSFQGNNYNAIEGKRTFEQYQCMGCHSIVGNGAYFGPDLTKVYRRMNGNDAALAAYLLSGIPAKGMPPMRDRGMSEEDAYRTVAFLKYAQMLDTNDWPNNGSWDRDGNIDGVQAEHISPSGIWQIVLGIIFFNLLVFGIIIVYEREKEGKI